MTDHQGGCLCGALRYAATADPQRVTYCHCRFCQQATGAAYMVEPVFNRGDFAVTEGTPATYAHRSEGSGKVLTIHFCGICSTKLFLSFERFPEVFGVYGGTFDDPNWFGVAPPGTKHIHLEVGRHGTLIPADVATYQQYTVTNDGTAVEPVVFAEPHTLGAGG